MNLQLRILDTKLLQKSTKLWGNQQLNVAQELF